MQHPGREREALPWPSSTASANPKLSLEEKPLRLSSNVPPGCGEGKARAGLPQPLQDMLFERVPTLSSCAAQCNSWGVGEFQRSPEERVR